MEPESLLSFSQDRAIDIYSGPDKSSPPLSHPISIRCILILFFLLRLCFQSVSSGFATQILYDFLIALVRTIHPNHLILLHLIIPTIFDEK
jgi:hypothetical protein